MLTPDKIKTVDDARDVVKSLFPEMQFNTNPKMVDLGDRVVDLYAQNPASTKYHGSHKGGLLLHTACVMSLVKAYDNDLTPPLAPLLVAAFFHDIGKLGRLELVRGELSLVEHYYKVNQSDNPKAPPYVRSSRLPDHVELAQYNLMQMAAFVDHPVFYTYVTFQVWKAITYHNGAYGHNLIWPLKGNESSLMIHLHFYDMIASREYV